MESKFTKGAYFYAIMILCFPIFEFLLYKMSNLDQVIEQLKGHWGVIAFFIFLIIINLFVIFWGFFVEINMRMSKIVFLEKGIEVKKFLGLGRKYFYEYQYFEGFVVRKFRMRGKAQEYCYLLSKQIPLVVFSSMYYVNYEQVKNKISEKIKELN